MSKLFWKLLSHKSSADSATRFRAGALAGVVGIVCNMILFAGKLTAGLLSGSVSITADALNNLSDASSSIVTLLGFRMARQPADKDHPYGHARYEYLSGLIVAALILLVGAELVKSSIEKIFHPTPVTIQWLTLAILIGSIGLKLWMHLFYRSLGKQLDSVTLLAAAVDSRNDVITSAAVLLGCLLGRCFALQVDGYIGLAVALFIIYSGCKTARETISPLLGQQADEELVQRVYRLIRSHDKVLGCHDLLIHDYGPGRCFASVHVELSAAESPIDCHDIIDHIEQEVLSQLNINLVVHYDPIVLGDAEQDQMRQTLEKIIKAIDPALSMHDFRLERSREGKRLTFDLAIPYSAAYTPEMLQSEIDQALHARDLPYDTVIRFDRA